MNCLNFDYVECSFSTNGGMDEAGATSQTNNVGSKAKDQTGLPSIINPKDDELNKEGCGRVLFWTELGLIQSYTLECNY